MMNVKTTWTGTGTEDDPRRVALPTYQLVEDHGDGTCTVEVPDWWEVHDNGYIDRAAIAEHYGDWSQDGLATAQKVN